MGLREMWEKMRFFSVRSHFYDETSALTSSLPHATHNTFFFFQGVLHVKKSERYDSSAAGSFFLPLWRWCEALKQFV